jgi:hypothetical protein
MRAIVGAGGRSALSRKSDIYVALRRGNLSKTNDRGLLVLFDEIFVPSN